MQSERYIVVLIADLQKRRWAFPAHLSHFITGSCRHCQRKEHLPTTFNLSFTFTSPVDTNLSTLVAGRASPTSSRFISNFPQPSRKILSQQLDMIAIRTFLVSLLALATTPASPTAGYLVKSHDFNGVPVNLSIPSSFDRATRGTLSRRWDGSPAMGTEFQTAKNKGCTLWAQMHADDAQAGAFFTPPRDSAHSDYLALSGK